MKTKYFAGLLLMAASAFTLSSCNDDVDYEVATGNIITTVETGEASVTAVSAEVTGKVLDLSSLDASAYSVGVKYGTNQDPTTSGKSQAGTIDETGTVSASLTGLTKGTTYYYAVYVTLQGTLTKYGDVKSFVATDAQIATAAATNVTACTATLNGQASGLDGLISTESQMNFGFKLATTADGVESGKDYAQTTSVGTVSQKVEGLLPGTTYYYAAYFQLEDGLVYGETQSFTTAAQEMEYVDLGLSMMWAKWNLGAEKESDLGLQAGYGDLTGGLVVSEYLTDYTVTSDIAGTENDIMLKVDVDGEAIMQSQLPTADQMAELISGTTQEWTTVDGVQGMRFTSKTNGNSIFLPAAGYREGTVPNAASTQGLYWTGSVNEISSDYGTTLNFTQSGATTGLSKRSLGLSLRSVRMAPEIHGDVSKIWVGNKEDNGTDIRIEIYNEYGPTSGNGAINTSQVKFSKNMLVSFTLSGMSGNLKDGAPSAYVAGLEYSDPTWGVGFWSGFNTPIYDAVVNGDGKYCVWMETTAAANGAIVFCIDIPNLYANLVDASQLKVDDLTIYLDSENTYQTVDNSKVLFVNKDGNGTDGRIEIYNEYGDTKGLGADYSSMSFNGEMAVTFTISGIDGNLVSGADGSYKAELSFADADWSPSYWGGTDIAAATVTGDGTYTVVAPMQGDCVGAVVWTIELYNLWKDLVDTSKVKVTVDAVAIPGK